MPEALAGAIGYVLGQLGLRWIMAKLLARLGFEVEGRARAYLKINGAWEDHVLTALIAPEN